MPSNSDIESFLSSLGWRVLVFERVDDGPLDVWCRDDDDEPRVLVVSEENDDDGLRVYVVQELDHEDLTSCDVRRETQRVTHAVLRSALRLAAS